jgi:uncharacterized protein (TIGR02001 family)
MSTHRLALAVASALLPASLMILSSPSRAEESPHSLSANVALTTNYMFRGISQTGNGPAVQGGLDYEFKPYSLYAGVWGSNVSSDGFAGASMELDLYAGWRPSWDKFGLDIGYIRYQYPTTDFTDNNTNEFHIGASYDFGVASPSFTVNYSDDWFGTNDAWYYDLSVDVPLPQDFTLSGHFGWNRFDDDGGLTDYQDWRIGVSREFYGLGFDLTYVDVSGLDSDDDCSDPFKCGETLVFTVSKEF